MNIKRIIGTLTVGVAAVALADGTSDVDVNTVTMTQDAPTRLVTISYTLSAQPAVITLDIETNIVVNGVTTGWASIGGEHVCNAMGDVWKKVENTSGVIIWHPDQSWKGIDGKGFKVDGGTYKARAKVTAWRMDNTPDYMVVDIASAAQQNTQTYYPSVEFLPGGVTNSIYKTSTILMRKIMSKGVKWTMGSVAESGRNATREATHQVTLTNNYYIGVFEVTQTQWQQIAGYNSAYFTDENSMRPMEKVSYLDIRQGKGTASTAASSTGGMYPDEPYSESFLGLLRTKTGIDFDLPSEAQWEFAARAGNGEGYWNDGSIIRINSDKDANLDLLGRYKFNGGMVKNGDSYSTPSASYGATNGTAIVGSYAPNAWGLYDTAGNVWEWCLDWYADDITAYDGKVNIDPTTPANTLSGASGTYRVNRGGSWDHVAGSCRSAFRNYNYSLPSNRNSIAGLRLACTAGLQ